MYSLCNYVVDCEAREMLVLCSHETEVHSHTHCCCHVDMSSSYVVTEILFTYSFLVCDPITSARYG